MVAQRKKEVNLLFSKAFEQTSLGRLLHWSLTVGRWIVIATELVVILCFLSRFKLDRDLMDLSETIKQQQAIIISLGDLENNFRNLQKRLNEIDRLNNEQIPASQQLQQLTAITPVDVALTELKITKDAWEIGAASLSESGFHYFLKQLKDNLQLENISLGEVNKKEAGLIEFRVTAQSTTKND